jgi:arylsulfatase A-like enzyme
MRSYLALSALALALGLSPASAREPRAPDRPNILFLLSDDQRWDTMGCAGNRVIHTPNMDALAKEGVRFRNMFVTTAICAASRASLLTGLYERTHRYTFGTKPITDAHIAISYPALLRQAGYRTGFVGKFGVGVEKGATGRMFDSFVPLNRTPYWKTLPDGSRKHLTDIEGERAVAFLDTVKPGQPFCLSVSFNAPHAEDNDPQQYFWQKEVDHLYDKVTFPVPASMADSFFNTQPDFLKQSESRVRFKWRFDEPEKYQRMVRGYYRMISGVDLVIGRIRQALKQRGLADNTVIVFSADNGYFLGDRGFADKWYIYEHSIRVPLIVHDPRAREADLGRVVDATALNVDLCPTFLELAGLEVPKAAQGRSLVPLLRGQTPPDWRTDFFYEHLFDRQNIPKSEGVRTERFTYVRWFEQKPLVEELYDHQADFAQTRNLIHDPHYAEVLGKMRQRATELRDQYGGPYRPNPADKPKK